MEPPSLVIYFESSSCLVSVEARLAVRTRCKEIQEDKLFQRGYYRIWLEQVLGPNDFGDPVKQERPKFLTMADLRSRVDASRALTLAFADQLLVKPQELTPWGDHFLLFPRTRIVDPYDLHDCVPGIYLNPVERRRRLYFHHIQHSNTKRAYFVCGQLLE